MASSNNMQGYGSDPASPHTTFVQADPSNFRAIVQKLTGAPEDPSATSSPSPPFEAHPQAPTGCGRVLRLGGGPPAARLQAPRAEAAEARHDPAQPQERRVLRGQARPPSPPPPPSSSLSRRG
ncbi:hypothetical protein BT93_F2248 [Corymbia citriodora subsp. variegata]|nr:hypothetical protein BT93_F2248 [Corymbia citriodora subsp. variegata]